MTIYFSIYNLIETYIFGVIQQGSYQELVCIATSTIFTLTLLFMPFYIVLGVFKKCLNI